MTLKQNGSSQLAAIKTAPGAINRDEVYRADEAKVRMGWRDAGFRAACRRGLRVHRCGKRTYVTGAALLDFITGGKGGAT